MKCDYWKWRGRLKQTGAGVEPGDPTNPNLLSAFCLFNCARAPYITV